MPTVSEQLRHAREKQQMSVEQVAEATKIKSDHVRALDEGNFDAFTAPVYIKGFVRSYANLLKLDVSSLLLSLDEELRQSKNFSSAPSLTGRQLTWVDKVMYQLSAVKWRIWLPAIGIVILTLAVLAGVKSWQASKTEDPLQNLGPGLRQENATSSGETLALPRSK